MIEAPHLWRASAVCCRVGQSWSSVRGGNGPGQRGRSPPEPPPDAPARVRPASAMPSSSRCAEPTRRASNIQGRPASSQILFVGNVVHKFPWLTVESSAAIRRRDPDGPRADGVIVKQVRGSRIAGMGQHGCASVRFCAKSDRSNPLKRRPARSDKFLVSGSPV